MKAKETVEEAAERLFPRGVYVINNIDIYEGARQTFIKGTKWQAERMYSEDEVFKIAKDAYLMGRKNALYGIFNKWFEQFKKKV